MALNKAGVTAVSEASIAEKIVQDYLTDEAVIVNTIINLTSVVRTGQTSVAIPRISGLTAKAVLDNGSEQTAGGMAVAADVMLLNQFREVPEYIYETADVSSMVDLKNQFFAAAPRVFGEDMESLLYSEMSGGVSAAAPDHILQMTGSGNIVPTLADIRLAAKLLDVQKVPQTERTLLVTPNIKHALLAISEISDASKTGIGSPTITGQFAEIYGFRLVVSNQVTDNECMAYHKTHACYGWQKLLRIVDEKQESFSRDYVNVKGFWGRKTLDSGKRGILFNATGA